MNDKPESKPWPSFNSVPPQSEPDFQYFVVFDSKIGHYRVPFVAINEGDVLRQFSDLYRGPHDPQNQYLTNPEDFQIFRIGSYYKKTGQFVAQPHEHIANLHELRSAALRNRPQPSPQPYQDAGMAEALGPVRPSGH